MRLMQNKAYCISLVLLIQVFCLLCPFVPPAFPQKAPGNLKKYKVEILPLKKETQKKYKLKLIHPYSFRLKTIQKCLASLTFKEKNTLNAHKGRVFNNDLVKRLAPLIQDRFSRANSNQRISFKISNASGKAYLQGDTFFTSQGLHWRLTALRGVRWGIEDFSVSGEPWGLILQKGQTFKQRFWQGSTQVAQNITSWIIFETVLPVASRKLQEPVQKPSNLKNKISLKKPTFTDVKERLRLLEQLRKENVITEKEYINKRKGILDQF
ncbi:MAG: hypothetical protein ACI8PD_000443 [Nitrospinales bacterium]|jgi:hypothetical protein